MSIIVGLLGRPGDFFYEELCEQDMKKPVYFLLISTVFFVSASLAIIRDNVLFSVATLALNSFAMPVITAAVSFVFIRIFTLNHVSFKKVFAIHAFAGGVMLLASWIPMVLWITEPWKWILIIIGYKKGCAMTYMQAVTISAISAGFIIGVFRLLINIII